MWCGRQSKIVDTCKGCKEPCPYQLAEKEQGGKVFCYVENKYVFHCSHFECIKKREQHEGHQFA